MRKGLNNKGFTLVELLATVVILLAISTIAITSISAAIEKQNEKKDDQMKKIIISYGRLYLEDNINSASCVKVSDLKTTYGLEKSDITLSSGVILNGSVGKDTTHNKYVYYTNENCTNS